MDNDSIHAALKEIKHSFMAFRNGIVADTLRKAGMPYNVIFGLQLPQISQIAADVRTSAAAQTNQANRASDGPQTNPDDVLFHIASALWNDTGVRESRILAPYLFPPHLIDYERAFTLASSVNTREEADILSFRLLKHLPFADDLARRLSSLPASSLPASSSRLSSAPSSAPSSAAIYCGSALKRNLAP